MADLGGLSADEAVFAVPRVGPAALAGEVAVGVVGEGFGGLGEVEAAGVAGDEVRAARARPAQDGDVGETEEHGTNAIIHGEFAAPVGALAESGLEIHGHGGVGAGAALDFGEAGDGACGVLVQRVGGVGLDAEVGAGGVAAVGGGSAVANVIETVLELLPGDGGAIGPVVFAGGDLAESVVVVEPVGGVGVGDAGALVGGVVVVGEGGKGRAGGRRSGGDRGQAFSASYCLVVVMRGWQFCVKAIWLTNGELAR